MAGAASPAATNDENLLPGMAKPMPRGDLHINKGNHRGLPLQYPNHEHHISRGRPLCLP